jgi:hypothetical protein
MTVHGLLVTATEAEKFEVWAATAPFSNWLDGRPNGDRETWHVMVYDEHLKLFLAAAEGAATVERIEGSGESETYRLLLGEPGSGWKQ